MSSFLSRGVSTALDIRNRVSAATQQALEGVSGFADRGAGDAAPPEIAAHAAQDEQMRAVYKAADEYIQRMNAMCEASAKLAKAFETACDGESPLDQLAVEAAATQARVNREQLGLLGHMMHRKLFRPIREDIKNRAELDQRIAGARKTRADYQAFRRKVHAEMERDPARRESLEADLRRAAEDFDAHQGALASEVSACVEARRKIVGKALVSLVAIQQSFYFGTGEAVGEMADRARNSLQGAQFRGVGIMDLLDQAYADCRAVREQLVARQAAGQGGPSAPQARGPSPPLRSSPQGTPPQPRANPAPGPAQPQPPPSHNLLDPGSAGPTAPSSSGPGGEVDLLGGMGGGPAPGGGVGGGGEMDLLGGFDSAPQPQAAGGGDLMGGMGPTNGAAHGGGAASDSMDDFLAFDSAPPKAAHAASAPPAHGGDDFLGFGGAPPVTPHPSFADGADPFASLGQEPQDSRTVQEQIRDRQARMAQDVEAKRAAFVKREAEEAERRETKLNLDRTVKQRVDAWRGSKQNMRAILSTLHEVLPPGLGWEPVSLANLLQPSDVKKAYKRAIIKIHPDKLPGDHSVEDEVLAQAIFDAVRDSWAVFQHEL